MVNSAHAVLSAVMRGFDPRIPDEIPHVSTLRLSLRRRLMDCRVKPGNDNRGVGVCLMACEGGDW